MTGQKNWVAKIENAAVFLKTLLENFVLIPVLILIRLLAVLETKQAIAAYRVNWRFIKAQEIYRLFKNNIQTSTFAKG